MLKHIVKIGNNGYYAGQYRELVCDPLKADRFSSPIEAERDIIAGNYLEEELDINFYNVVVTVETIIVIGET